MGRVDRTEEHVLEHNGLLGEAAKVAIRQEARVLGDGLLLDARPGEVDVEEEQEYAEANDGRLFASRQRRPRGVSS